MCSTCFTRYRDVGGRQRAGLESDSLWSSRWSSCTADPSWLAVTDPAPAASSSSASPPTRAHKPQGRLAVTVGRPPIHEASMHGLIFLQFQRFAQKQGCLADWESLLWEAQLPVKSYSPARS